MLGESRIASVYICMAMRILPAANCLAATPLSSLRNHRKTAQTAQPAMRKVRVRVSQRVLEAVANCTAILTYGRHVHCPLVPLGQSAGHLRRRSHLPFPTATESGRERPQVTGAHVTRAS